MERWLTQIPPRVLDFWEAFDRIEPIGDQWQQTAMIAQQLSQGHSFQMAAVGKNYDPKPYKDFMPARWKPDKTKSLKKKGFGLGAMRNKLEERVKKK